MSLFDVLIRPIVTEQSTLLQESGKYVFQVQKRANKADVKAAVEKAFDVTVLDVNTMRIKGKNKRFGPRPVRRPDWKKAVVTLQAGDTIQLFEGA
ncbi:MAG: 50S ribosomal protein L23 [Chloroflexi bacterium]|nr:50S ribosomal protein L23 [Chloroflexota bacterium]MCH8816156.1 50S ribosomal protein L23 [Chloroflexota bacterium]